MNRLEVMSVLMRCQY